MPPLPGAKAPTAGRLLHLHNYTPPPGTVARVDLSMDKQNWDLNPTSLSLLHLQNGAVHHQALPTLLGSQRKNGKARMGKILSGNREWGSQDVGWTQLCGFRRSTQITWALVSPSVKTKVCMRDD